MIPFRPRRAPEPAPERAAPDPVRSLLTGLGAVPFGPLYGFHVYCLIDSSSTVFYVGKSTGLASRIRDHIYLYGQDRLRAVQVIPCRNERHMAQVEDFLIAHLQPVENKVGNDANLHSSGWPPGRSTSQRKRAI